MSIRRLLIITFCLLCFVSEASAASKVRSVKKGNDLYNKGDYPSAIEKYQEALGQDSESDIINFNLGTALYKNGDYTNAIMNLQKSLLSDKKELKPKAQYNLGNALYKNGIRHEKENVDFAIQSLERSLKQYENILKVAPADEDAKYNYDFVKKELERLKKKNQSSQKNSSKEKNQQGNQKQQGQQRKGDQKNKQDEGKKEEQKNEGKEQDQQEEKSQKQSAQGQNQKQNSSPSQKQQSSASSVRPGEMSKKEAEQLLRQYQQSEEPKGLLQFQRKTSGMPPVIKDW